MNPITSHYEKLMKYITIKDDVQLPNRKLKNVYCVDINSGEIIFDLMEIRVKTFSTLFHLKIFNKLIQRNKKKNIKIKKSKQIKKLNLFRE